MSGSAACRRMGGLHFLPKARAESTRPEGRNPNLHRPRIYLVGSRGGDKRHLGTRAINATPYDIFSRPGETRSVWPPRQVGRGWKWGRSYTDPHLSVSFSKGGSGPPSGTRENAETVRDIHAILPASAKSELPGSTRPRFLLTLRLAGAPKGMYDAAYRAPGYICGAV